MKAILYTMGLSCLIGAGLAGGARADELFIKNESPRRILVAHYTSRQINLADFYPLGIDGFHVVEPGQTLQLASSWRIPRTWICIYNGDGYYVPQGFATFDINAKDVYRISYATANGTLAPAHWEIAAPPELGGTQRTFPVNPQDVVEDLDGERLTEVRGGRVSLLNQNVQTFTSVTKQIRHATFFQPRFGGESTKVFTYQDR
jgi:hypothetical protein